jgi:hypothetical protein
MDTKKISIVLSILIFLAIIGWGAAFVLESRSVKRVPADQIAIRTEDPHPPEAFNCASSTDAKVKEDCFGKIAAAIDADATSSCSSLVSKNDQSVCEKGRTVRDAVASSSDGIKECQKLKNSADIDVCEEQVLMYLAITKHDPKKCDPIKNPQDKELCLVFFKAGSK